ncbi:uncharacterized protein LOC135376517 [Ornithodoros turicata]|uniref:uncharacterized protein LOC135376517 n=1 Tax=Ornithodoros turicata TaxID=34597 RepID=UPI0031389BCE
MRDNCQALSGFMLNQVMLPGTHKSGNYDTFKPEIIVPIENVLDYQEEDIFSQLVYGIRFLDIRVRAYNSDFWVNREDIRGQITVKELLRTVKSFVRATGEIVAVDFHRFIRGFEFTCPDRERNHKALVKLIVEELKDVIAHKDAAHKTLGELMGNCSEVKGKVIVSYKEKSVQANSQYFLPASHRLWSGARSVQKLKKYLEDRVCLHLPGTQTVSMAEMHALFPFYTVTNREFAQEVNGEVTKWFRDEWWKCANVVATDFFLGNDIINVAIKSNVRRVAEMRNSD